MLLASSAISFAEDAYIPVYTLDDLAAMGRSPWGRYRLMNDIDMGSVEWVPMPFSGEFDGGGHCLYNLRVVAPGPDSRITRDGNRKEYDTVFLGLFSVLDGASVHNLRITGAYVATENTGHCFAAILAGMMDRSSVSAVFVSGRVHMTNRAVMAGVAGVVGYGCGTLDRCEARVELVFEDRNLESRCEEFMGGILACGIGTVNACSVDIDGYDSCHGYVHNGGLVGMYYHCGMEYDEAPVTNNIISGRITFFEENPDRRAYCEATVGEPLSKPTRTNGNIDTFESQETKNYDVVLLPETCEVPAYETLVTPPTAASWGYTQHRCSGCGYHWTDSYTPPRG
ncbi:MAG: hypothetical protein IJJ23_08930 [Clostridia bacterium]|nr:hypothetical protein [Clostridia bacterium]